MKRHIAIPLLCVVLVAALSIPVFATSANPSFPYPENNITGFGAIDISFFNIFTCSNLSTSYWLDFGQMWIAKFAHISDDPEQSCSICATYSFSLSVNVVGSFYVACVSDSLISFTSIQEYRDSSLDYTVDFGDDWPCLLYEPSFDNGSFVSSSDTGSVSITFLGYTDVPIGQYTLEADCSHGDESMIAFGVYASGNTSSGGGTTDPDDPDNPGTGGGSGVTGNSGYTGFNNIVDKFQNGNITYTDALDQLGDRYDFIHTTDIYQNILYVNEYQMSVNKLNGMVSSSAASKSNSLDTQMQGTIDQFADGSIDLKGAMDSLSGDFSTALSGAQTVEEAQAVTAVYQANLRQLETRNQMKMMQAFDDAMSDEEFQQIQDYYAAEGELINAFDVADFDAQLQFDNWFLLLPQKEAFDYKRFFDYLLNDSEIRHFIIIPLTMGLVSIIMGTRMRVRPSSGGKGDDD